MYIYTYLPSGKEGEETALTQEERTDDAQRGFRKGTNDEQPDVYVERSELNS